MKWRALPTLLRLVCTGHTDGLINSVAAAWDLADLHNHVAVSPEHLLAGMARCRRTILDRLGLGLDPHDLVGPTAQRAGHCRQLDDATLALLSAARGEARALGHPYLGTEHVVIALLLGPDRPASEHLRGLGIGADDVLRSLVASA